MRDTPYEFEELLSRARESAFLDQGLVGAIALVVEKGDLSRSDGEKLLRRLFSGEAVLLSGFASDGSGAAVLWEGLDHAMSVEAALWQRIANRQYLAGLVLVPLAVTVVLAASFALARGDFENAVPVLSLAGVALAAVSAHSFFVFRIHQQARLAAERLGEKRAATLFLRLALAQSKAEDTSPLLARSAEMFLLHHAASTIPLQPSDYQQGGRTA